VTSAAAGPRSRELDRLRGLSQISPVSSPREGEKKTLRGLGHRRTGSFGGAAGKGGPGRNSSEVCCPGEVSGHKKMARSASTGNMGGRRANLMEKSGRISGGRGGDGKKSASPAGDAAKGSKHAPGVPMSPATRSAIYRGRSLSRTRPLRPANEPATATTVEVASYPSAKVKPPLPKLYAARGERGSPYMPKSSAPTLAGRSMEANKAITPQNKVDETRTTSTPTSSRRRTLTRDERRRSRSLTARADPPDPPSKTSPRRSLSSPKRFDSSCDRVTSSPDKASSRRRSLSRAYSRGAALSSSKTPPRKTSDEKTAAAASKKDAQKTPPRKKVAERTTPVPSASSLMPSTQRAGSVSRSLSPTRQIFDIIESSKLVSLCVSNAVLPMQQVARAYLARLRVERRRSAILKVQSVIRRWNCEMYYQLRYESAQLIAVTCQSTFRGIVARDRLDFQHYCAGKIQSALRGFLGFLYFMDRLGKIILLQSLARRYIVMKAQRESREDLAAVTIQTNYRRYKATMELLCDISDIMVCQTIVRRFLALRHTKQLRAVSGVTKIQANWRRYLASEYFIFMVSDVIVCQSVARRSVAVRNYNGMLVKREAAAVSIQKTYRGFIERMDYADHIANVVTTQSIVRRFLAKNEAQELRRLKWAKEFVQKEVAATAIRAAYLGYSARIDYLVSISNIISSQCEARKWIARKRLAELQHAQRERAATKIRAVYLGYIMRIDYLMTISDVIYVQKAVRMMLAMKEMRCRQVQRAKDDGAATRIRAAFLGYIKRIDYILTVSSVITCQSVVRRRIAMKEFEKLRQIQREKEYVAARKIQSAHRGSLTRIDYNIKVTSIIMCQSVVRRMLGRNELKRLKQICQAAAATKIRAVYLGYTTRLNYVFTVADVITIQKSFRGIYARKVTRELRHLRDEQRATRIQTIVRGARARDAFKRLLRKREYAAIAIQKIYRGFVAYDEYTVDVACVICCQSKVRQGLARDELVRRRHVNRCAIKIQTFWRSYNAQAAYMVLILAAISIQSAVRCRLETQKYHEYKKDQRRIKTEKAIVIQTQWRSYKTQTDYAFAIWGVISIQSMIRGWLQTSRYKEILLRIKFNNATMIQSRWRSFKTQTEYTHAKSGAISIQSLMRGCLGTRRYQEIQLYTKNKKATVIQSQWRSYKTQTNYAFTIWGAISIQSLIRGWLQTRRYKEIIWHFKTEKATAIQSRWRSYKTQTDYAFVIWGAISIQSLFRGWLQTRRYKEILLCESEKEMRRRAEYHRNTVKLQAVVRRSLAINVVNEICEVRAIAASGNIMKAEFMACENIQAWWRNVMAQRDNKAATAIQSCYRGYRDFLNYVVITFSSIQIQSQVRGHLARCLLRRQNRERQEALGHELMILHNAAATAIQSCYRGYEGYVQYIMMSFSIVHIQAGTRGYLARCHRKRLKLEAEQNAEENAAATAIQSCFRGYRDFVQYVMVSFFIIRIQTGTRGYLARCQLQKLKQEREEHSKFVARNVAAINIQACFRGYRDFVVHVMKVYFAIKIQSCIRGNISRDHCKHLKRDIVKKKQKKMSRVSSDGNEPQASLSLTKKQNKPIRKNPKERDVQQRLEKKAALVIERFFIRIKAEIEMEMARLEQKTKKKKKKKKDRKAGDGISAIGVTNSSRRRDTQSRNVVENTGQKRNALPSKGRIPSFQSVHQMGGFNPSSQKNVSQSRVGVAQNDGHILPNENTRHNAMRNASPSRDNAMRVNSIQSFNSLRNEGSNAESQNNGLPKYTRDTGLDSRNSHSHYGAIPSVQQVNWCRNSGFQNSGGRSSVGATQNSRPCNPHYRNDDLRKTPHPRERMPPFQSVPQHGGYTPRNASPSRQRMASAQTVTQHGGYTQRNASPLRQRSPSVQSAAQHGGYTPRNASPSRQRMPQSAVQHAGYSSTPTPSHAQMHTPSQSSYGNRTHPHRYPPFSQTANLQHTPKYDSHSLQSNSFASNSYAPTPQSSTQNNATHWRNPPLSSSHQSVSNIYHNSQTQRHNSPLTSSNQSVATSISYQSTATPMADHYGGHQRHPARSQSPIQAQKHDEMKYQKRYNK